MIQHSTANISRMRARLHCYIAFLIAACAGKGTEAHTGFADVNGGRLYFEEKGRGPAVVLLQGGQMPLQMWDEQFDALAKHFHVVRYDARGFGRSSAKLGTFAYHDDLYELLRWLRIERASLVGLSLGGRVAIDFVLQHPNMVDRLVLAGPGLSGFHFSDTKEPWTDSARVAGAARDSNRVSLLWLESGYMKPAMRDSALASRLRRLTALNASLWMQRDSEIDMTPPAIARLSEIPAPTLVILGGLDIPDIRAITDTLVRMVPGARRVVIEDAGHMVNMEKPAAFNRALLSFLGVSPTDPP